MHPIDAELRPALAPEVVGHLAGVAGADHRPQFLDALCQAAMHLADAIDLVARRGLSAGAADLPRRIELRRRDRGDRADRLAPADDVGVALLVGGVLRWDALVRRG